jgi:hypothetical protein
MSASWLRQMGWRDVLVLAEKGYETGVPISPILGPPPPSELRIDAGELARLHTRNEVTIIDLSLSREHRSRTFQAAGSRSAHVSPERWKKFRCAGQ